VQSVQLYGAFINIGGGVSGLLHVSQISHERITNVMDVLRIGNKVKVLPPPPPCALRWVLLFHSSHDVLYNALCHGNTTLKCSVHSGWHSP